MSEQKQEKSENDAPNQKVTYHDEEVEEKKAEILEDLFSQDDVVLLVTREVDDEGDTMTRMMW